jgi:predicted KAP-like P-loop ATPase
MLMGPLSRKEDFKILTDDPDEDPILDSKPYGTTIAKIVLESFPKFSIGIYGEWGTGKTTLMKLIEKEVQVDHVLTIWFNAWRYEREEQFAVVALMKTIAFGMTNHPIYKNIRRTILRGLKLVGEAATEETAGLFVKEKTVEKFKEKLLPKREFLEEVDKETIYFDGIKKIEEEMQRIRKDHPNRRVVVFIDDLDRCSPEKALEVFESIKVFLDIEGFVFIIGLSHRTIAKLITALYEKSGVRGEDYIQKIIQIPVLVPEWNKADIDELITNLSKRIGVKYAGIIDTNKSIINSALRPNPRELKQFINNFIIANEIFSTRGNFDSEVLLAIHALRTRWPDIYNLVATDEDFRDKLTELSIMEPRKRGKFLKQIENKEIEVDNLTKKASSLASPELFDFLNVGEKIFARISDWDEYRRAVESVRQQKVTSIEYEEDARSMLLELDRTEERIKSIIMHINTLDKFIIEAQDSDSNERRKELAIANEELRKLTEHRDMILKRTHDLRNKIVHGRYEY